MMQVLHILNDGPSDDAQFIIDQQAHDHDVQVVDLSKDDVNYDDLVDRIEQCDKVFSW